MSPKNSALTFNFHSLLDQLWKCSRKCVFLVDTLSKDIPPIVFLRFHSHLWSYRFLEKCLHDFTDVQATFWSCSRLFESRIDVHNSNSPKVNQIRLKISQPLYPGLPGRGLLWTRTYLVLVHKWNLTKKFSLMSKYY